MATGVGGSSLAAGVGAAIVAFVVVGGGLFALSQVLGTDDGDSAASNQLVVVDRRPDSTVDQAGVSATVESTTTTQPPTDLDRSIALFQSFQDAAAVDDWQTLRELEPTKADYDDDRFYDGYWMLEQSRVVPIRTLSTDGAVRRERIGLVTNEYDTVTYEPISRFFCLDWLVDLSTETIDQTGENTIILEPLTDWVDLEAYDESLLATC